MRERSRSETGGERSRQSLEVVAWHRRLLGPLHVTGAFWYRFHLLGVRVLPRWALHPMMLLFTGFFVLVLGRMRRAIAANLEAVLGPAPAGPFGRWRRAFRTIHNHAWCMTDNYLELAGRERIGDTRVEGAENWQAVTAGDRGFVVVTAHVGQWQVGSRLDRPGARRPVHVVREPEIDPRAQEFFARLLEERSPEGMSFHFSSGDPSLGPRLLAALRRGEVVALQGDRPSALGRTATVELFGRPVELPVGAAALARAAEVPLLPVFVFRRRDGGSELVLRPPIEVPRSGNRRADLVAATAAVADQIEWAIRRQPFQWFCFRPLWPQGSVATDGGQSTPGERTAGAESRRSAT